MSKEKRRAKNKIASNSRPERVVFAGIAGLATILSASLFFSKQGNIEVEKKSKQVLCYQKTTSSSVSFCETYVRDTLKKDSISLSRLTDAEDSYWFSPIDSFSQSEELHRSRVNSFYSFFGRSDLQAPALRFVVPKTIDDLVLEYSGGPLKVFVVESMGITTFARYEGARGNLPVSGTVSVDKTNLGQAERKFTIRFYKQGNYSIIISPRNIVYAPCEGIDGASTVPFECMHWSVSSLTCIHLAKDLAGDLNGKVLSNEILSSKLYSFMPKYRSAEEGFVHGVGLFWLEKRGKDFGVTESQVREKLESLKVQPEYSRVQYFYERAKLIGPNAVFEEYRSGNFPR